MSDTTKLLLLGSALIAIWLFCYRFGAIGVRGGGVSRDEAPAVYWLGMVVLALAIVGCFVLALWPTQTPR